MGGAFAAPLLANVALGVGSAFLSSALSGSGQSNGMSVQEMSKAFSERDKTSTKQPGKAKAPAVAPIAAANAAAASPGGTLAGNSSTFLTGPGGVDPNTLLLGKNVLLGQ